MAQDITPLNTTILDQPPADPSSPSSTSAASKKAKGKPMLILVVFLVIVAISVATGLLINNHNKSSNTSKSSAVTVQPVKVTITADGFDPANLNIVAGSTVTWTNTDTAPHQVASDPYPTNNGLPGFDSQEALNNNDTYAYTFDKTGTFTYHDQLHPFDLKGTVVVGPATAK